MMTWRARKRLKVFAGGTSLRRRVAYSLAVVRLILVPVILLALYYLFAMGRIVDRIVRVNAPVANLAERMSIEMLDARRAERNYFLLHDPAELQANRQSLSRLDQILAKGRELQPEERGALERIQFQLTLYRARFEEARVRTGEPAESPAARIREVIRAYEKDLNDLLKRARRESRGQLTAELQYRVGSLDAQIAATLAAEDPALRQITLDLQASGKEVLRLASELEKRSWDRVQRDHHQAKELVRRAEWVIGIISGMTILLSVWVSFILPREVVRPLADLKAAVDHAAAGNYEIEFDVQGDSELAQLANSVRGLIAHVREKKTNSVPE
jgi:methyl-accepting chemotaxis protein